MIDLFRASVPESAFPDIQAVLESGRLVEGDAIRDFERAFGEFIGNPRVTTCSDYSNGLVLALYLAGIRPGDEVICSPVTCLATTMPVLTLFARIVWCDVDPRTGNIDPTRIAELVSPRTRAILATHWGGDIAELDALAEAATRHGLALVEDASEALGGEFRGKKLGADSADFTVFSFYANKPLCTIDGGAIAFRDEASLDRARWMKRYSIPRPRFRDADGEIDPLCDIPEPGFHTVMNNVTAAIGIRQLELVHELLARHRANGLYFDAELSRIPGIDLCPRNDHARSSYWVYTLRAERRDDLLRALRARGVYASRLHLRNDLYSAFRDARSNGLSGVDAFTAEHLCVPCGWWVSKDERELIVDAVRRGW